MALRAKLTRAGGPGSGRSAPEGASGAAAHHAVERKLFALIRDAHRRLALTHEEIERGGDGGDMGPALAGIDAAQAALSRILNLALGGEPALLEECSIVEAVLRAASAARIVAATKNVDITVECSPRLLLTPAGPTPCVIANALANAIDASAPGGRVELIAELSTPNGGAARVLIDVYDEGEGVDALAGEDPFTLGFTTRSGRAGVGLPLCKAIIEELRGELSLMQRARGGARFQASYPSPIAA